VLIDKDGISIQLLGFQYLHIGCSIQVGGIRKPV